MDKVTYTVIDGQETRYHGKSERTARKIAKTIQGSSIVMSVVSGTYQSTTQIYPTLSNTYSA